MSQEALDQFINKLSSFNTESFTTRFDSKTAIENIKFVDWIDVPQPLINDTLILDVQWKVDFSRINPSPSNEWSAAF